MKIYEVRERTAELLTKLLSVWEASVRATHIFLSGTEIEKIKKYVPQVLSMVGIADKSGKYPDELSAGEQQRVAIARAIVNKPRILIADEPTGNLDPDTAWEIMQLLDQINMRGTTILMVTHAKDIVDKMGKRVIAIENGRIVRDEFGLYGFEEMLEDAFADNDDHGIFESDTLHVERTHRSRFRKGGRNDD